MSQSVRSDEYKLIESLGIKDADDFVQFVQTFNVVDMSPDPDRGEWFYIDQSPERGVIYTGHFSSAESIGSNWHAEVYDLNDEDDKADFEKEKARLESEPEDDPDVEWKRGPHHYPPADADEDE